MSRFTDVLVVSPYPDGKTWYIQSDFGYDVGTEGSGETINVPVGFTTDFASVPRLLWIFFPKWGRYGNAAVVHDYLYFSQQYTRGKSDRIFLEAMEVLSVPRRKRYPMYWAVRGFGWISWRASTVKRRAGYVKIAAHGPQKATDLPQNWRMPRAKLYSRLIGKATVKQQSKE